ncbi:transformer-2 protein homolog beta isoform X2 [Labrus bergylta]|uniref:transformer-2 protein homolog beta isoform X2 n=1 Tax=Labrus bergylta TaxID=56723 RepID=UPI0009B3B9A0|nr:transformer-2 protein homolog beta isoform X2 [Labrus bergylta]
MSDNDKGYGERESRSGSRSLSPQGSGKSASRSPARSPARSKEGSRHSHSRSRSRSRSKSRSHSRHGSRRHYSHSRSRSRSYHRRSHSRSYSGERRRRSHSRSPMSNRRRHIGNRANPDPNCCLGVFGLSLYTTERDLRDVFSKYGPLADVSIVYDQQSRRSRGFSFVYFENKEDAKEAKERANGMELDGRRIRVDFSITKRPHTPTPGIYMGRPTYGGGGPSGPRRNSRDCDRGYDRGYDRGGYDRYDDREYYRSYRCVIYTHISSKLFPFVYILNCWCCLVSEGDLRLRTTEGLTGLAPDHGLTLPVAIESPLLFPKLRVEVFLIGLIDRLS